MGDPADFIRLIRPVNSVMIGFAVIVGAVIGGGIGLLRSYSDLVFAFVTGFTLRERDGHKRLLRQGD